jgi:hypothetical protein
MRTPGLSIEELYLQVLSVKGWSGKLECLRVRPYSSGEKILVEDSARSIAKFTKLLFRKLHQVLRQETCDGNSSSCRITDNQGLATDKHRIARNQHAGRLQAMVAAVLLFVALVGLAVAFWVHTETFAGIDPSTRSTHYWVLQLVLFVLLLPPIFQILARKSVVGILTPRRWVRAILNVLLGYYVINFYLFLSWSADHIDSRLTWRMFSSGWLLLFGVTAAYYAGVRSVKAGPRVRYHG